jgi:hypothetical protein
VPDDNFFEELVDSISDSRTDEDYPPVILIHMVNNNHFEAYVPEDPQQLPRLPQTVVLPK